MALLVLEAVNVGDKMELELASGTWRWWCLGRLNRRRWNQIFV
jgi:hypothetical protein